MSAPAGRLPVLPGGSVVIAASIGVTRADGSLYRHVKGNRYRAVGRPIPDERIPVQRRRVALRGNTDWPRVGIFAQRGKDRPNRIGVSRCAILGVDGLRIAVRGLDAVDGTPVLDLEPWMDEFAPQGPTRQPAWASELMAGCW